MAFIFYLTHIHIGADALHQLKSECERIGIRRPLIVSDKGVVAAGIVERVTAALEGLTCTVFDDTPSNPTEAMARLAADLYLASECDGMIAVGGGSSIDLAKGAAILATHPGELKTYATIEGGSTRITAAAAAVIAVPTTSGTGSEVARGSIMILNDGRKLGFHSWHLLPRSAICDPVLTLGLPPYLTAATGMDAIAHCVETFLSAAFNPPADGIALDGLERAWSSIDTATNDGSSIDARLNMMSASMQGAMAFQKGLGAVHSLSHPLGGLKIDGKTGLHHGTLNAIMMPAVLRFNAEAPSVIKENKIARLKHAMHLPESADIADAVATLCGQLGLPAGLEQVGVRKDMFEAVIQGAMVDHCHKTNPREATPEQYRALLNASF